MTNEELIAWLRETDVPNTHAAADVLEEQAKEIKQLVETNGYVWDANEKLHLRIAKLEAALKPFADIADDSTANLSDDYWYSDCFPMSAFRAARTILNKTE